MKPAQSRRSPWAAWNRRLISRETRDYFIENMAMQLSSGMDVVQAIDGLVADVHSGTMRRLLKGLRSDLSSGLTLWQALERTGLLSKDQVALVRIGERVGRLPENLTVIVSQAQKQRDFRSRLQSATLYPVFVLTLTVVVGIGVAWFILPRLATIFSSLHVDLPTITVWLIAIGTFFGEYGTIAAPAIIVGCILLFLVIFIIWPTKVIGQWILLSLPGIRNLLQQVELARLGYVLGTLLQAGLPIVDSLNALVESTSMFRYRRFYRFLAKSTAEGNSLRTSFKLYRRLRRIIPGPIQQMILAAEQSGHLPDILLRVGDTFEKKTENTTKNLAVILEPILLVIVWLGVVTVALAVVLPVYSLIGKLNT